MKAIFHWMLLAALLLGVAPLTAAAATAGNPFVTDLITEAGGDVGDVKVWSSEDTLFVEFQAASGWCVRESRLHVADSLAGIPVDGAGMPLLELFDYLVKDPCIDTYTYEVPLTWPMGTQLYLAAYADVSEQKCNDKGVCTPKGPKFAAWGAGTPFVPDQPATYFTYTPSFGTWQATGSMQTGRSWHTLTLLADGRVLAAGGSPAQWGESTASAETYDPTTGTWQGTNSMQVARRAHIATLLPDGRVLVAGGEGPGGWLASAEIYDPVTGTWSATGSMQQGRSFHTATLLPNGKVLVTGGYGSGGDRASAEIYDPATGTWQATGSMKTARMRHRAILLPDGRVLVCGGSIFAGGTYPTTASTEIYDPASGQWSDTGNMIQARHHHQAILLPNGQVLAAGGITDGTIGITSAEFYDPATGVWTPTGSMQEAHASVGPMVTLLPTGRVLISGGAGVDVYVSIAVTEIYSSVTGSWTRTDDMAEARSAQATVALTNGTILTTGGNSGGNGLTSAEVFVGN